jgi:LacI family gluconate utilization system Gnt-I transcriptional repressor
MARAPRRGSGWVTMADVARRAGVSLMTVSRVYRSPRGVSEEVRQRVAVAAEALGYVPNLIAGNLSSSRSRFIAAVVPSLANSNFATTVQGLSEGLRDRGYQLLLAECGYDPEEEARVVASLLGRRPDGLVLTGVHHDPRTVAALRARALPVVETWEHAPQAVDMAVGFSNHEAGLALARHVVARGRRRIGYLDFHVAGVRRFAQRLAGVRQALAEAGLPEGPVAAPRAPGFAAGAEGLRMLLEQEPALDAVLCSTDVQAVGVLFACQTRGWAVPGRLAVAGFGDFEIAAQVPPGLTSLRTRGHAIGSAAAALLLARLEGGVAGPGYLDVGHELVVRGSS